MNARVVRVYGPVFDISRSLLDVGATHTVISWQSLCPPPPSIPSQQAVIIFIEDRGCLGIRVLCTLLVVIVVVFLQAVNSSRTGLPRPTVMRA